MQEPEILNQHAIDGLLAVRPHDAGGESEVRPYNFLRPTGMGGRAMLAVETAQGAFAQRLRKLLTVQLRTPVEVAVTGIETVLFSEFALSLGAPCAASLFHVKGKQQGYGLLDWGTEGALAVVDRLLGGTGASGSTKRALTAIEQGIVKRITAQALGSLAEAWSEHLEVGREVLGFEQNLANTRIARPEDRVLTAVLRVSWEGFEGTLTVGLPHGCVASLFAEEPRDEDATRTAGEHRRRVVAQSRLKHTHLAVTARLPRVMLGMGEIAKLAEGRVIDLGHGTDTPAEVHVNGRLLFLGAAGDVRGHVGIRITDKVTTPAATRATHMKKGRVL